MSEDPPHASIVVCTRNRHDKIGAAIESLLAQDYPSYDVTVIDQSTTDETERALDRWAGDSRLHYVHSTVAGLSRAYNRGIRESTGDILAFTDDDCLVRPDWLATIVAAFSADQEADLLYGSVDPLDDPSGRRGGAPYLTIAEPERLNKKTGFRVVGMGANFAARRRLFDRIGGFDEVLGGGGPLRSSQDFDLAYRAYHAGSTIVLRPDVTVIHDGFRADEDWPSLLLAYGIGDGAFYTKHARCRDPYAIWLLVRQLGASTGKWVGKRVLGRDAGSFNYVRGFTQGMRQSFRFPVDRVARMYVPVDA
jgi:glycosyltransferase involved in cell wall biosynthesis